MSTTLRIASFNIENWDEKSGGTSGPTFAERLAVTRPLLERTHADVICFQEVHGQEQEGQPRDVLALKTLLAGTPFASYQLASTLTTNNEVYDVRNLVVASRFDISHRTQLRNSLIQPPAYQFVSANPPDTQAGPIRWERPIQYVRVDLPGSRTLHVINLHLKSRIPSNVAGQRDGFRWRSVQGWAEGYFVSSMKRVGQALEVRVLVDQIFDGDPDALIAVCGDFNAADGQVPVEAIRGRVENTENAALNRRVLFACEDTIADSKRYSLIHAGHGEMLDHVIVSRSLLAFYRGAEVHNETIHDESIAFGTDKKFPEPDHAPLVAEFELP